jgi:hypothetical protein
VTAYETLLSREANASRQAHRRKKSAESRF